VLLEPNHVLAVLLLFSSCDDWGGVHGEGEGEHVHGDHGEGEHVWTSGEKLEVLKLTSD